VNDECLDGTDSRSSSRGIAEEKCLGGALNSAGWKIAERRSRAARVIRGSIHRPVMLKSPSGSVFGCVTIDCTRRSPVLGTEKMFHPGAASQSLTDIKENSIRQYLASGQ
jgi:hypothetical protein